MGPYHPKSPIPTMTSDTSGTTMQTLIAYFSWCSRSSDLDDWPFCYFHSLLSVLFTSTFTTIDRAAKNLWKVVAPLKIKITMWLVVFDRLPTNHYLHRRHIRPLSSCTFSGSHPESPAHIFLSSPSPCESGTLLWLVWIFPRGIHPCVPLDPFRRFETFVSMQLYGPFDLNTIQGFLLIKRIKRKKCLTRLYSTQTCGGKSCSALISCLFICYL